MIKNILLTVFVLNCFVPSHAQQDKLITFKEAPQDVSVRMIEKAKQKGFPKMNQSAYDMGLGYILKPQDRFRLEAVYMTKSKKVPFAVYGAIADKYAEIFNEASELGYPQMDEKPMKDGAYQFFEKGAIYWSNSTGAHIVRGDILGRYMNENYANGFLGFPVDDLKITPDKKGSYVYFQGGCIYRTPAKVCFAISGNILKKWGEEQFERGFYGYPISEAKVVCLDSEKSSYKVTSQEFEGGMIVTYSDLTFTIPGSNSKNIKDGPRIFQTYRGLGGTSSWLRVPVEKAIRGQGVWLQQFTKGYIYVKDNEGFGYTIHKGPIWNEFAKRKWEQGCGYVIDEQVVKGNVTYQVFSKGTIYYLGDINETVWKPGDNGKWYLDRKKNQPVGQSEF